MNAAKIYRDATSVPDEAANAEALKLRTEASVVEATRKREHNAWLTATKTVEVKEGLFRQVNNLTLEATELAANANDSHENTQKILRLLIEANTIRKTLVYVDTQTYPA